MSPLSVPPASLDGFPAVTVGGKTPFFRIHGLAHDPWWFCGCGHCRFDLAKPRGACYLALEPLASFVEVFRGFGAIAEADVASRGLATLRLEKPRRVADCTDRRARRFGVTAAIHATPDYTLTQAWARAFDAAGFDGIRYHASHDPAVRLVSVALFSAGGVMPQGPAQTGPIPERLLARAEAEFGIATLPSP